MISLPNLAAIVEDSPAGLNRTKANCDQLIRRISTLVASGETIVLTASETRIDGTNWGDIATGMRLQAECEHELMLERRRSGTRRAAQAGHMGRYKFTAEEIDQMIGRVLAGETQVSVAKQIGCNPLTIYRYVKRYRATVRGIEAARQYLQD